MSDFISNLSYLWFELILMFLIQLFVICILNANIFASIKSKLPLKFDEFFNYTHFPSLSLSPDGQNLLIDMRQPSWDTNSFDSSLWLYDITTERKTLITKKLSELFKPCWSSNSNWVVLLLDDNDFIFNKKINIYDRKIDRYVYLYAVLGNQLLPIHIGKEIPTTVAWSHNDSSLYVATLAAKTNINDDEWKDVIQYREYRSTTFSNIYRIDVNRKNKSLSAHVDFIRSVPFLVGELIFVPFEEKLVFTSMSNVFEKHDAFEIYSINLKSVSSLQRLTHNQQYEKGLQLSWDGRHILFQTFPFSSNQAPSNTTQARLYSINLANRKLVRLGKDFDGSIVGYAPKMDGGVYMLGQIGTNIHIYSQKSPEKYSILHDSWEGTYEALASSMLPNSPCSIAFVYSSYERPKEVYCVNHMNRLHSAKIITNDNRLFTERNLPKTKLYRWINSEDDRTVEGILHYPPEKFEAKNLSLLVLIHDGPYAASLNTFDINSFNWALLAASEGWLVLEPNYRGSTGYGDQYLSEIRHQPLSRPGRDVLSGVDSLINDGTANPNSLSIGGYSFGGILTNWLITQTTRFHAALSGAGSIEHASCWGSMDLPILIDDLFGGFPWEVPDTYQHESSVFYLSNIRTPTHIVTSMNDLRIPADQSFMLERGLDYLNVPSQLLIFPNEQHTFNRNPWHGKIKLREELKWLKKYSHTNTERPGL